MCVYVWKSEDNLRYHFLDTIHAAFEDSISHWLGISHMGSADWPESPRELLVFTPSAPGLQARALGNWTQVLTACKQAHYQWNHLLRIFILLNSRIVNKTNTKPFNKMAISATDTKGRWIKDHLSKNPQASFRDSPLSLLADVSSQEHSKRPQ